MQSDFEILIGWLKSINRNLEFIAIILSVIAAVLIGYVYNIK